MAKKFEEILEILRDRIIQFGYKPGTILNEQELATEFDVSRTPVRLVLQELERDGLIEIVARYGAQVTPVDLRSLKDLFDLTRFVDPYAAKLACERISQEEINELKEILEHLKTLESNKDYQEAINYDEKFHRIIFKATGNEWLEKTIIKLHYHTERLWHYCNDYFIDMKIFTRTFSMMIEAFEKKDPELAELAAREHIDDFLSKVKESLFR